MKKCAAVLGGVVVLSVVALAVGSLAVDRDLDDNDSNLGVLLEESICGDLFSETPKVVSGGLAAAAIDPNTIVYLFPRDSSTTATVIFLVNTDRNNDSVNGHLRLYDSNGDYQHGWWFSLGAGNLQRVCTDDVPHLGWWRWNIGNYSYAYAQLELPPGVVADGYVVWNNGSSYDYDDEAHTLPLRFMSELVQ